jgi:hypothetical protein
MRFIKSLTLIVMGSGFLLGCSSLPQTQEKKMVEAKDEVKLKEITHESVSLLIEDWPENSKAAANSMMAKYGLPLSATKLNLVWKETDPFILTKVYRDEITHNFPMPHTDVIEQVVEYKVPAAKVDDLWHYNGSILLDRTQGVMSARCEKEEMNILALNLADEIIRNKMSVEEARLEFAKSARAFSMGNTNQYINSLNFRPESETADPDMALDPRAPRGPMRGYQAQEAQEEATEAQEVIEETEP